MIWNDVIRVETKTSRTDEMHFFFFFFKRITLQGVDMISTGFLNKNLSNEMG
jgi:hypothetical protein